jgi:P pilus assembly chaperone PapD
MATASFAIPPERNSSTQMNRVKVDFINDYGGAVTKEFPISLAP